MSELFKEFQGVSTDQWIEKIKNDLKGADFNKKMLSKTYEGLDLKPFYHRDQARSMPAAQQQPGQFPFLRGNAVNNSWRVRQDFAGSDLSVVRQQIQQALKNDVQVIGLQAEIREGNCQGLPVLRAEDLAQVIDDLPAEVELKLAAGLATPLWGQFWCQVLRQQKRPLSSLVGGLEYDPLGEILAGRASLDRSNALLDEVVSLLEFSDIERLDWSVLCLRGRLFHQAGAGPVMELALLLALGHEYLCSFQNRGQEWETILPYLTCEVMVGSEYFQEIAKIRALRWLWAQMVGRYNHEHATRCPLKIQAVTSQWNLTSYDPHVNLLRATTEAMSAIIGGCESVTVLPFDLSYRESDEFSSHLTRNIQHVLREESALAHVVDPAAGSYYVESLTQQMGEAAWDIFCEIEAAGGLLQYYREGKLQRDLKDAADKRRLALAQGQETLLGTNQFPLSGENLRNRLQQQPGMALWQDDAPQSETFGWEALGKAVNKGQGLKELSGRFKYGLTAEPPVANFRGAEAFERLRLRTESFAAQKGSAPRGLLLPFGHPALRTARMNFSRNFLACAGYELVEAAPLSDITDLTWPVDEQPFQFVVFCSADDDYPEAVPALCQRILRQNPPPILMLAGDPGEHREAYEDAGVSVFLHRKLPLLITLEELQRRLGVL